MKLFRTLMAAATALAVTAFVAPSLAADDPGLMRISLRGFAERRYAAVVG